MKMFSVFLFVLCITLALAACTAQKQVNTIPSAHAESNDTAVDGKERASQEDISSYVESITVTYGSHQEEVPTVNDTIPVLKVLSACNINMDWMDDDSAVFELQGKKYFISISTHSIIAENSTYNCILIPPGTVDGHISSIGKEIYVDSSTMRGILFELKIDASIN